MNDSMPVILVPPDVLDDADLRKRLERIVLDVAAGRMTEAEARAALPAGCSLEMLGGNP